MTLTATVGEQHGQVSALLDDLQQRGLAGPEGRERLQKARQAMLAHLDLEDGQLYPALEAHAATAGLARRYAGEMRQLTPALLAFFDAYLDSDPDPQTLSRSLGQLLAVLQQRIRREEGQLYPAYDAHCGNDR